MPGLEDKMDRLTAPGVLYERLEKGDVRCYACAHHCLIHAGRRGICKVRFNQGGELRVPWGYVAALHTDPVEKKPFSHLLPGSRALTFGMLGCNFHCSYCQNWLTSQTLRDPAASALPVQFAQEISAQDIVAHARQTGAQLIVSSYNEPLITSEWAIEVFKKARQAGLQCAYVSNGYGTPQALEYLAPYLTGYKIDLKTMQDSYYRSLGGVLQKVLDTIQLVYRLGLWLEVVTLVIPGFNDSREELWDAGRFLASVSPDIPWHLTAFHPDYQMTDTAGTPAATLQMAAEIGQEAGLHYVYAGNLPGRVGSLEDTFCPHCQEMLIQRRGFVVQRYRLTANGACPRCATRIAGVWTDQPESVRTGDSGLLRWAEW
ncbi:MAG TPA: AmmeMemoRadiSam system radical SAM enzyme [Levilinea sp.]|nr:AmmeMemoRadiSam system radical SAM enzyme [Levilinea sp.]